jgi:Catalase
MALSLMGCASAPIVAATAPAPNADGEVIPATEGADIAAVTKMITDSVSKGFATNGRAFRDAHRKAHGCVTAKFNVQGGLPPELAQGVFAQARSFDAVIRYSNGSGQNADDNKGDGRGMAIKLFGVQGPKLLADEASATTQDFVMINHPVFFVRNAADYVSFQKSPVTFILTHAFTEGRIALAIQGKKVSNPLASQYWSMTPYKLGNQQIKYSAKPCAGSTYLGASTSANKLGENLTTHLASKEACFDFMVQTRKVPAQMPIEDATAEWKESASPFVPVAKVVINTQQPEQGEACEIRSFTPWHSLPEHRPLGGISRVRKAVYLEVSTLRHQLNSQPRIEP